MSYARRLHTLARHLGLTCPRHAEQLLQCPACEPQEPLPEVLEAYLQAVLTSIMARMDRETLRTICMRRLPPRYAPCGRCGRARQCSSCQVRFTKAVFADVGLTAEESRMVDKAMHLARALDARRNDLP